MAARIMIVEDEGIVALELEHSLVAMGYAVCAITDKGEEAITLAEKENPDLILMDIRLKGRLSGIEAAHQITQKQGIPIVYLTANSDLDTIHQATLTQPYAYILKPYEERELQTTLDITLYRHQAQQSEKALLVELERRHRLEALGTLAGGIAHDFNNVLASIIGNLELAIMQIRANGNNSLDLLETALASTDRAKSLARQLLTFARGGTPLKVELELGPLLSEVVSNDLYPTGKSIKVKQALPDDLWQVLGDKDQLGQAISILITNAIEASSQDQEITLKAQNIELKEVAELTSYAPGQYVKLSVADQGEGISNENLSKIFDPYFTTKPAHPGLGLTIAYSIVNSHGGYLEAKSALGKGSVFSIYLPATPLPLATPVIEPLSSEPPLTPQPPEPTKLHRVLVMDDDSIVRLTLGMLLESLNWEVELTEKGEEALQCYARALEENNPFEVVILDLTVKNGMGGKETIEKLLALDPKVKAIVSSGYSDDDVIANYQKYGFTQVLPKPYGLKQLETALANCTL